MPIYKRTNNDTCIADEAPSIEWVEITQPELEQILATRIVQANPADVIRAQIKGIELAELTPRNTREALIYLAEKEAIAVAAQLGATPEQVLAANIGYQNAKAIDLQITALRAQIQALES